MTRASRKAAFCGKDHQFLAKLLILLHITTRSVRAIWEALSDNFIRRAARRVSFSVPLQRSHCPAPEMEPEATGWAQSCLVVFATECRFSLPEGFSGRRGRSTGDKSIEATIDWLE
jgi:hypothetical protein